MTVTAVPTPAATAPVPPPVLTYTLIAINALAFVWETLSGTDDASNASLVAHGALFGPLVTVQGQWWRIVTSAFLHLGVAHIGLNMLALLQIGRMVEYAVGSWRMLAIYAISLAGGGYAVVVFAPNDVTLGASGAIFGLFGALLAIGLRLGSRGRALIGQTLPIVLFNVVFTFAVPFISKAGHIGGLVSGFFAGLVFFAMRPQPPAAVVTDTQTGETQQAELLEPDPAERAVGRD